MAIVKCFICSKEFERSNSEIKRNKKNKRKIFCSRKCSGEFCIKNIPEEKRKNIKHLRKGSFKDEYSPFRFFLRLCKMRIKQKPNMEFNLTLQDLKDQWDKQNGKCPYTGWSMKMAEESEKTPDRASLDRIDSKKGYIKGNIQFVSLIAQYAKNNWNSSVIFEFANAIKNN